MHAETVRGAERRASTPLSTPLPSKWSGDSSMRAVHACAMPTSVSRGSTVSPARTSPPYQSPVHAVTETSSISTLPSDAYTALAS
eukprot:680368-Pleurochrysis_carterae.AAC.2